MVLSTTKGSIVVYRSVNAAGEVQYVGLTNNMARRAAKHLRGKGISIRAIPGLSNLTRMDARAVEQALIEIHGLGNRGGTLINKINSISPKNSAFNQLVQQGMELLRQVGYPV